MNTSEVAAELGTSAKILRRFLRADDKYSNPGIGGKYEFVRSDMPTMKRRFDAWAATKKTSVAVTEKAPVGRKIRKVRYRANMDTPLDVAIIKPIAQMTRAEKAALRELANARVDRLEARLRATGMHISQRKG